METHNYRDPNLFCIANKNKTIMEFGQRNASLEIIVLIINNSMPVSLLPLPMALEGNQHNFGKQFIGKQDFTIQITTMTSLVFESVM